MLFKDRLLFKHEHACQKMFDLFYSLLILLSQVISLQKGIVQAISFDELVKSPI